MRVILDDERRFNELCEKYWKKFRKGYGATLGDSKTLEEHNAIMEDALKTGIPVKEPVIPDGIVI